MVTEFFDLLFWVAYMSNVGQKKTFPPPPPIIKKKYMLYENVHLCLILDPSCQISVQNRNIIHLHHGITI